MMTPLVDDDIDKEEAIKVTEKKNLENDFDDETLKVDEIVNIKESKNHPLENVIGNLNQITLRLKAFLMKHEYNMGMVDNTLFTKKKSSNLIIVQIYVDNIIFDSTCQEICDDFAKIMHDEFEMSMMGELNFFLGLQIKQMEYGIFLNQSKYIKEMLKKFGLEESKPMKTPMSSDMKLMKDEECESVDSTKYRGMIGSLLYLMASRPDIMSSVCLCARFQEDSKTSHLEAVKCIFRYIKGCCLTLWFLKKQTALAISMTKAEYVSAGNACQQALWMKKALIDYDIRLDDVLIMCDNKGAIGLSKILVIMPRVTASDHKNTRSYIPKISNEYTPPLKHNFKFLENRYIHEGWVVYQDFDDMVYLQTMFGIISFDCLFKISEQIVPRFILEFYSQFLFEYNSEGHMFVKFVIQNKIFSLTLEEFGRILDQPIEGQCSFTDKWSLDYLESSVPSNGLYQTTPPTPDDIKLYVQVEREEPLTRIRHDLIINDYVPTCLCHMLYCIAKSKPYDLTFFVAKRVEWVSRQAGLILPNGVLLTRLFKRIMSIHPELSSDQYIFYDRVTYPLAAQHERKKRKDYGIKKGIHSTSTSSSSAFDHQSSSHQVDEDDNENDEGLMKKYRLNLKNDMSPRDKKHFKTLSLDESRSPDFDLFSDQEEYSEEEVVEKMAKTMEQYMTKTRADYGSGVARPKIEDKDNFELKGQFLKELHTNTFSGSDHEDANEHIEKVLVIVDLFHIPNITIDQVMHRAFPMYLTRAASHWLRNKPSGSITTWEDLKTKFLSKYCPPARTAKKIEEINNFQQEPDENLYQAWERFKELLMKQILDSRGVIPSNTAADAKVAIQEMARYSQKWHNGTSRTRSTETFNGLVAIQAQLNNLGREIKKVNEKVYLAQVGCEQCKDPHYTKDCPLKEEGKILKEAYYTQFGAPFQ
ncbi:retrovirus-related pol polyprotein from transposon TNT 1-94 [Tanacetum coccineum]